ncbi:MAG: sigma-70 family RNA polymerase sigma factor [Planctomycetes bacterium]|nr:sigma-70 family RNA polymerase sigma factor [Planctomycetota bacterium]MCH8194401.1 sigma-70 family RNA polymerase sigma factor [Planctomycetota bacterium]
MAPIEDFEAIAMGHLAALQRAAVAICGRTGVADDMVQTTLLKAYERFDSFEEGTNCKAWLLCILRNSWVDYLRVQQRRSVKQVPLEEELVADRTAEETVWSNAQDMLDNFSDEHVIRALQRLPEEQRLTLFLVDVEQMTHEEVAEIMGVAVGTIKSRTSRARGALKVSLADYAQEMNFRGHDR